MAQEIAQSTCLTCRPGLYRFTLTGDFLVSADLVATTAGRDIFYFGFIDRDDQSAQELVTVDAGTFVLEIDAGGGDSWQFDIVPYWRLAKSTVSRSFT